MKKYFFAGLATLLPLAVTIWIVVFIVDFLTKPFMGAMTSLLSRTSFLLRFSEKGIRTISELLILLSLFLFVLFLGFVGRRFFFHQLLVFGEAILKKIPLVNRVYKTTKDIVQSLFVSEKAPFKQVVLLSFPYKGCYCIGVVTSDSPAKSSSTTNREMISVFIPTTPNPTTGFLVMLPKEELIYLEMKSEEAIKYIVSCAMIQPEKRPAP